jgi:hypothetical protein
VFFGVAYTKGAFVFEVCSQFLKVLKVVLTFAKTAGARRILSMDRVVVQKLRMEVSVACRRRLPTDPFPLQGLSCIRLVTGK